MDARDESALTAALALKPSVDALSPRWRPCVSGVRQTALFEATSQRWVEGVKLLLAHGASPWAVGSNKSCAIDKAFEDADEVSGIKQVWEAMLGVPGVCAQTNTLGKTLLHIVCDEVLCSEDALRRVLQHPQDVNTLDGAGRTALSYLAQRPWNFGAIKIMVDHGADPFHKGEAGSSAEDECHPDLRGQMIAWWRARVLASTLPAEDGLGLACPRARL